MTLHDFRRSLLTSAPSMQMVQEMVQVGMSPIALCPVSLVDGMLTTHRQSFQTGPSMSQSHLARFYCLELGLT